MGRLGRQDQFNGWWAAGALIVFAPSAFVLSGLRDFSGFLFVAFLFFPAVLLVSVAFMTAAFLARGLRRRLSLVSAAALLWGVMPLTTGYGTYSADLRDRLRWWKWEDIYKKDVLDQPVQVDELSHVVWESWGMAGMESTAYLVFDPADSLSDKAGRYGGVPCLVSQVTRLEDHWYLATMFTNSAWEVCAGDESFPGMETLVPRAL